MIVHKEGAFMFDSKIPLEVVNIRKGKITYTCTPRNKMRSRNA
jgi:hypothetical protein